MYLLVQRWCPWCGDHMGSGGWWLMMLFWIVLLAAIVWIGAMVLRRGGLGSRPPQDSAETLLRERFARGEIDEATYRRMLDELRGKSSGGDAA